MREFLVLSRKGITSPDFNFKDLPGFCGRIDLLARCVNSALWVSHGIRRDVVFHTILQGKPDPPKYIRFEGDKLKKVPPDERGIALFIQKALERYQEGKEIESTPGIFVSKKSLQEVVKENSDKEIYILHEKGIPINEVEIGENPFFILGDHIGLPKKDEKFCLRFGKKVSLGKKSYLASHCITIVNYLLDQRETE